MVVSLESFSMALIICSMGVMPGGERRGRREEGEGRGRGGGGEDEGKVRVTISKLTHGNTTE